MGESSKRLLLSTLQACITKHSAVAAVTSVQANPITGLVRVRVKPNEPTSISYPEAFEAAILEHVRLELGELPVPLQIVVDASTGSRTGAVADIVTTNATSGEAGSAIGAARDHVAANAARDDGGTEEEKH